MQKLKTDGRRHAVKYMEAFEFCQELAAFWGDSEPYELLQDDSQEGWEAYFAEKRNAAEATGKRANEKKMAGFYVDLSEDGESLLSPADIEVSTIAHDLQTAAQVVEMLLIKDHTRMKHDAETPYDSTHEQQHRLLPVSPPRTGRQRRRRSDGETASRARRPKR